MASDMELTRRKRELELRRKMLQLQNKTSTKAAQREDVAKKDPSIYVKGVLIGRGEEVLETARRYYPAEIAELETKLAALIQEGKLKGPISAEELYSFLRQLGLRFSLDIKIRVSEHGRLKSLEERLRDQKN
ncbi:hypothetical protein E6H36_10720 [Candidatus Bathyarchaeota archaeon]|nr:MAG: hypothetical protein E6H36_10720 [Candidatus Bathyarchaeota archaeon]TMI32191.1 MAG: hypothetical protein E6H29_02800 [Candidatus Bathyarchaeota archaeon]